MFNGFSSAASDFLWGVRFNNYRSWFMEHKQEYLTLVQQPLKELAGEVFETFTEKYPDLDVELHVSRIYRDARRLHGKGPYKDHLWFSLKTWDGLLRGPMFWFEIGAAEYSYGMGFYSASPAQMEAYRAAMEGIYSTSVGESTLDESPMAYKSLDDIIGVIGDTAEIIDVMKPVYNFKASD